MEAAPEVLCIIFSFSTTCTIFVYLNNILYIMPSKKKVISGPIYTNILDQLLVWYYELMHTEAQYHS